MYMTIMNFKKLFVKMYLINKNNYLKMIDCENVKLLVME